MATNSEIVWRSFNRLETDLQHAKDTVASLTTENDKIKELYATSLVRQCENYSNLHSQLVTLNVAVSGLVAAKSTVSSTAHAPMLACSSCGHVHAPLPAAASAATSSAAPAATTTATPAGSAP
jgi:hypothetical protein